MTMPDPKESYTTPDGVEIPLGKGTKAEVGYSSLLYNEYPFYIAVFSYLIVIMCLSRK